MQKFGGISRYFCELMRNSESLFEYDLALQYSDNSYLKEIDLSKEFFIKKSFKGKYRILDFLNRKKSEKNIRKVKFDIFHPTYYNNYYDCNKPTVITVYDMIHELFPQYFSGDRTIEDKYKSIHSADFVIAISESTKNDLLRLYPDLNPEKVKVTYLGNSFPVSHLNYEEKKKDYILFTGNRENYKNFDNFVKAIAPLLIKYNLNLICTGKTFSKYEKDMLENLKISNKVTQKFASEAELSKLYREALCFVFPSMYEGFGIPVLESFASGCPLVVSNSSSLSEIAGSSAQYFDPYSIDDMSKKIEDVVCSESLQKELISSGYTQLKKFSWEKCAEETSKIYEELLGKK